MKNFEQRWQECARAARAAAGPVPAMPPGFAGGVLARVREDSGEGPAGLWLAQARWILAGATLAMVVCAALDYSSRPADPGFRPPIETAVVDVMTRL